MKKNLFRTAIGRLRVIALAEGLSFLILLCIAMPLKYYAELPLAVKITGWIHGLLFMLYICSLAEVKIAHCWTFLKTSVALIAGLFPFGTFVLDVRVLKKELNGY